MVRAYMYILKCNDDSYYTGSTTNIEARIYQYQNGNGANHTAKRLPVELIYFEEFTRVNEAFYREKQVQKWSRNKKETLITNFPKRLVKLAECMNTSHYKNINNKNDPSTPLRDLKTNCNR